MAYGPNPLGSGAKNSFSFLKRFFLKQQKLYGSSSLKYLPSDPYKKGVMTLFT